MLKYDNIEFISVGRHPVRLFNKVVKYRFTYKDINTGEDISISRQRYVKMVNMIADENGFGWRGRNDYNLRWCIRNLWFK